MRQRHPPKPRAERPRDDAQDRRWPGVPDQPERFHEDATPRDDVAEAAAASEPGLGQRFKDFLKALPSLLLFGLLLWWLWPSGGLTVAFLGWLALGIVCAPLVGYLLFVAGFFWIFRRSARK